MGLALIKADIQKTTARCLLTHGFCLIASAVRNTRKLLWQGSILCVGLKFNRKWVFAKKNSFLRQTDWPWCLSLSLPSLFELQISWKCCQHQRWLKISQIAVHTNQLWFYCATARKFPKTLLPIRQRLKSEKRKRKYSEIGKKKGNKIMWGSESVVIQTRQDKKHWILPVLETGAFF